MEFKCCKQQYVQDIIAGKIEECLAQLGEDNKVQAYLNPKEPTRVHQVEKEEGESLGENSYYVQKQMGAMFAECKMFGLVEVLERAKGCRETGVEAARKVS